MPLGIFDVVHGDHAGILFESAGSDSSEFLHVGTTAEQIANMNAQGTNVGTCLAGNPEYTHVALFVVLNKARFVDGSHTELLLYGGDQWGSLEKSTGESINCLLKLLDFVELCVELDDGNVLFTSGLLSLNETGWVVDAGDQASSDLGVEGAGVACLFNLKNLLDPGDDLVGRGVGGLIEVDHAVVLENVDRTVCGWVTAGEWGEVGGFDVEFVKILKID